MDARELDRAIDRAAGELIAREPSRALSYNVMARVREREVLTRRGAWVTAASVCAAGLVVAYLAINRPTPEMPPAPTPQVARTAPAPEPAPRVEEREAVAESRSESRARGVVRSTRAPAISPAATGDVMSIEPIGTEAIVVPSIEVPRLEPGAAASIDAIQIETLTIEPLAASND